MDTTKNMYLIERLYVNEKVLCFISVLVLFASIGVVALAAEEKITPKSEYVTVSVLNLSTGNQSGESLPAGLYNLKTSCTYSTIFPIAAGALTLSFANTLISSGAENTTSPISSTVATFDSVHPLPMKQTITYTRGVKTNHAALASKQYAGMLYTDYSYGPNNATAKSHTISYTVEWNRK